jgi:DNA-binding MarR family transcriptional regulator
MQAKNQPQRRPIRSSGPKGRGRDDGATYSPRIEDCIRFLVGKAAQQITRRCRDALADLSITPVQYAVLNVLWERDGQSLAELGARLLLDSATMTGVADRLEAAGLVSRGPAVNGDRRVSRLLLTEAGHALAGPAQAILERVNGEVAAELGAGAGDLWRALRLVGRVDASPAPPGAGSRPTLKA